MAGGGGEKQWYVIPGTSVRIPMPPGDLATALVMVFLFLPVVVILTRLFGWRQPEVKKPAAKQE